MSMSTLMPKRSHVQCPSILSEDLRGGSVLSEDLRGGSLWGLQEGVQKSKPQIRQKESNGKPSLHLSREHNLCNGLAVTISLSYK